MTSRANNTKLKVFDYLLHDHVELPQVFIVTVHLVNLFCWMSRGDHPKKDIFSGSTLLSEHSLMGKSYGVMGFWWWW